MDDRLPDAIFHAYFSPYTAHAINVDGLVYPTVEHAYQCQRYDDQEIVNEIRAATSPVQAWEASARHKHRQLPGFRERKLEVMKWLMTLKVQQHADVRQALLDSGSKQIVKHVHTYPPGDGFWDDGENGEGLNHMGRMWMEIRIELTRK